MEVIEKTTDKLFTCIDGKLKCFHQLLIGAYCRRIRQARVDET